MGLTLDKRNARPAAARVSWCALPPTMRVLHITTRARTGGWLAEAFAADSASEVILEEAVGTAAGLARLRDEAFDAVLVSHAPGELDALDLIEGYRAGGAEEPIVVLGTPNEQEMAVLCYEVGADGYVCVNTTTTRHLIWIAAQAIQRHQLVSDNRRLRQAEQGRLLREHDEAERLLAEQRALVCDLEALRQDSSEECSMLLEANPDAGLDLSEALIAHYRELLRTYVIMGAGNLACELRGLAGLLVSAGINAQQTLQLHLHVVEELVRGLGARSTRHVMTRADLLVLEVMIHLAEGYRRRYEDKITPPRQQMLPGFE